MRNPTQYARELLTAELGTSAEYLQRFCASSVDAQRIYDCAILAISRLLPLETDIANPLEAQIATRLIDAGLAEGYTISVHEGEDWAIQFSTDRVAIMKALASTCMDRLYFHKATGEKVTTLGWVLLVYGNGEDLISDYIDNIAMAKLVEAANAERTE